MIPTTEPHIDYLHHIADVVVKYQRAWRTGSPLHPKAIKAPAFHVQLSVLNTYNSTVYAACLILAQESTVFLLP